MWKRVMLFAFGAAAIVAAVVVSRGGAPPSTTTTTIDGSVLGFPGATGWSENDCAEVAASDVCLGQWRHDSGQVARVLLLPVPERLQPSTTTAAPCGRADFVFGRKTDASSGRSDSGRRSAHRSGARAPG